MTTSTAEAISDDSGAIWHTPGAWQVSQGVYRIPLPLPSDGLRVNVYVIEAANGLVLIDGGWAIPAARRQFERAMGGAGLKLRDIRAFFVTHAHRDHYTLARVLGTELGVPVSLGLRERPALRANTDPSADPWAQFGDLLTTCGAPELALQWAELSEDIDPSEWADADTWLDGDRRIKLGDRVLDAVHTPGHTPGHYVFGDLAAGLLFAGDHVLPTITPSIGFVAPTPAAPLRDYLRSLAIVRAMPDLMLLPAHGPVRPSTHVRADELLNHHEERLAATFAACPPGRATTASEVANNLPWTRRERRLGELGVYDQALAVMETRAHLQVLGARGLLEVSGGGAVVH